MNIPSPLAVKSKRLEKDTEQLTPKQIQTWMNKHGFGEKEFGEFLGVTPQAVRLWLNGAREFSITNSRILKLLDKNPRIIADF
jgi:DNA-binding transcriptional regulator YiaG